MGTVFSNQQVASIRFEGDGARTAFPFDFEVFDSSDLRITVDEHDIISGFHISLGTGGQAGGQTGGTVRFETPPAVGSTITLARVLRLRRLSSYDAMSIPRGDAIERDLDFITAAIGDVDRGLGGTLRLAAGDVDLASAELPDITPGRALVWNADGDGIANGPQAQEIGAAQDHATRATDAANRAEAAETRCETAQKSFGREDAGAMLDLDFCSGNLLAWEDERRMPVVDAPVNRIMDIRDTGSLVRLSNGARLTLPNVAIARNGVRYRVFNGDGTLVDITAASGDVILPTNGAAQNAVYGLPLRGDMVDVICDGGRWFACPVREAGPLVKLLKTGSQSIPAGGAFLIEWDQVIEDSHSLYDIAHFGPMGLPPGFYHIDIGVRFPVTDETVMTTLSVERYDGINWSSHLQANDITAIGMGAAHTLRLSGIARIGTGSGSGLRVRLAHTDSTTRDIGQSDLLTFFHLHRIGG
ncbi:hypothetical protein [Thalassospira sp.]|uniref:hypothetical protein n=1 Tax=Thalassospira sp. TaxID=1912094 RepID=UPI0032F04F2B